MKNEERKVNTIVYAGRIKDRDILLSSSSGGAFCAISDVFLERGDAVCAAVYNYETHVTEYRLIQTKKERDAAMGSKYMQSKTGNIFRTAERWLKEHPKKRLLFVGMGCQADGFRRYMEAKNLKARVSIVDIICHGSSSPALWRDYAKDLEQKNQGKITYLTFKDKRNGWRFPTAYVKIGEKEVRIHDYVRVFYNACALRPSCHECPFSVTERKTDMTIGDFWHIEKTIPDFYDEKGNSLILIHTPKGKTLFEEIAEKLDFRQSDTTSCWQENLEHPTPRSPRRSKFWEDYQKRGIQYLMKKYGQLPFSVRCRHKIKRQIKKIIGK